MAIGFYFGSKQLPVNPASITIRRQGANQRSEVIPLGEINILRTGKLQSIAFDFMLPGDSYYPFLAGPWASPESWQKYFNGLVQEGDSVKLVISDVGFSQRVSVEDFSAVRTAGDHDSLQCSISLLEYRSYGASTLLVTPTVVASTPATRPVDKPQPRTYTVKSGDSFWRIAQQQLGNGNRYNEVAAINGMTAASVIHPGDVLKLPDK